MTTTEPPVAYFNSGCWTELPCHYLTVSCGAIRLHAFEMEPEVVAGELVSEPVGVSSAM